MTTIAYNYEDGEVAVDSRKSNRQGVIVNDSEIKAHTHKDGSVWVIAGCVCDIPDFMTLKKNDLFNSDVTLDCVALVIREGGVYYSFVDDGIFCEELITHNFTLGSGRDFALAALDFDKSAKEAVEYAKTRDIYTGGDVKVYSL